MVNNRVHPIDFLRGIAVLGILFINIENFAYPDSWSPWKFGFKSPIDQSTRFWVYFLTQGKFYTIFALLFGVSFCLLFDRLERNRGFKAVDIYSRRLLWLFLIGLFHAYFIWTGDVLYHYAICGFFLLPFKSFKSKNLILVIIILATFQLLNSYNQTIKRKNWENNYQLSLNIQKEFRTNDQNKAILLWEKITKKKLPINSKIEIKKKTFLDGLKENYKELNVQKGLIYRKNLLFSTLLIMLLGILLYRSGIFINYRIWNHYWFISFLFLIMGLIINYFRHYHWTYQYNLPVTNIWKGWLFSFSKEILGICYLLVLNGLYQNYFKNSKIKIINLIGRTALSNYILQNSILGLLFYGYGLQLFNQLTRFELLFLIIIIWLFQILLSWLWLKKYNQGPIELLWKKLTYGFL